MGQMLFKKKKNLALELVQVVRVNTAVVEQILVCILATVEVPLSKALDAPKTQ